MLKGIQDIRTLFDNCDHNNQFRSNRKSGPWFLSIEHKNQKMSDFLGIAQKVRHFIILVPKTAMRCLTCRKTSQSQKMKNRFLNLF